MSDEKYDPLEHIMSSEDAAKLWDISEERVRALCREGKIRAKRLKRDWAIDKNQLYQRQRSENTAHIPIRGREKQ